MGAARVYCHMVRTALSWQVEGWSYVDAVHFSVVPLATIVHGDIAPQTDAGKLFTVAYILVELGVTVALISSVTSTGIDAWIPGRQGAPTSIAARAACPRRWIGTHVMGQTAGLCESCE